MKRHLCLLVFGCTLLLGAACGGGGGGGGAPPMQPTASITFSPATAGANSISLTRVGQGSTTLILDVMADSVTDLYGVAFDLRFPSNLLRFDGADEGAFLSEGGQQTSFLVSASGGVITVGATRLGDVPGRSGSGVLMTLRFTAQGSGNGNFTFSANQAFSPSGSPQSGVTWAGGSVQTQL